ncbi:hypothetical protein Acr_00g0016580 [Actinidia rufa]|uniref:Uncharacterized protein n=1 Tax=Actinidia rufa TaxID=165716 RepID=A0A7J0DB71_9ERIC|nr:hypothetical protein Acr_00g0016580 [Actinidia rufa]
MALNRGQLLVHDDEALAQFRVDHRIPDNIVIEGPDPNNDADWQAAENRPVYVWAHLYASVDELCLNRAGYGCLDAKRGTRVHCRRPATPVLHRLVLGQWEFPADEPNPFSVPRYRGYIPVGFNARFWRRSDQCSAAISAVNNCGRTRKVSNLLSYIPLYRYTIPHRSAHQGLPVLLPLRICDQTPKPRSSLSDEVSDLFERTLAELRRLRKKDEGENSDSSESSSSSWDVDLGDEGRDEEAEVKDGKEVDQIPVVVPLGLVLVAIPPAQPHDLDHIIVPSLDLDCTNDIAIVKPWEVVEHSYNHSSSSSSSFGGDEEEMAPKVRILGKGQATRDEPAKHPKTGAKIATLQWNQAQQEAFNLKAFASGELPTSPRRYSPIVLPNFNEEEYAAQLTDEGDANTTVVGVCTGVEEAAVKRAEGC